MGSNFWKQNQILDVLWESLSMQNTYVLCAFFQSNILGFVRIW